MHAIENTKRCGLSWQEYERYPGGDSFLGGKSHSQAAEESEESFDHLYNSIQI